MIKIAHKPIKEIIFEKDIEDLGYLNFLKNYVKKLYIILISILLNQILIIYFTYFLPFFLVSVLAFFPICKEIS